jgi:hypothetical protein
MTHRSYNQSVFSLALASRGLVPTRIVHEAETFEPRTSLIESVKPWFVSIMAAVFAVIGLGQSLPTG